MTASAPATTSMWRGAVFWCMGVRFYEDPVLEFVGPGKHRIFFVLEEVHFGCPDEADCGVEGQGGRARRRSRDVQGLVLDRTVSVVLTQVDILSPEGTALDFTAVLLEAMCRWIDSNCGLSSPFPESNLS